MIIIAVKIFTLIINGGDIHILGIRGILLKMTRQYEIKRSGVLAQLAEPETKVNFKLRLLSLPL